MLQFCHNWRKKNKEDKRKGNRTDRIVTNKKHISENHKTDELIWPDCFGSPEVLDQFGLKSRNPPDTYW